MDAALKARLIRYLPAHRAADADQPAARGELVQHLNSLHKALASFLPLYIEDEIRRGDAYSALRPGTCLFADVSGFTALSERLQRADPQTGAEILTGVMNEYFAEMLDILAKSDGQLLKFAGDALLAFFPTKRGSTNDISDALKAVRTGLRMQRAMQRFQPITHVRLTDLLGADDTSQLTMSIGIARGRLFEALVGGAEQRDHLIQGELPGMAMRAESIGKRDEVIVDAKLAALLVGHFSVKRMEQGFSRVVDELGSELGDYEFEAPRKRRPKSAALVDRAPDSLLDALRDALERVEMAAAYVAPAIVQELVTSGDYHLHSENRLTATLFIYAGGFADMLRVWGDAQCQRVASLAGRYYDLAQHAITSRGGTLARTDPFHRGIKLLATFGAPIAHDDDADRAVEAALALTTAVAALNAQLAADVPDNLPGVPRIHQCVGVTFGHTFAGEVGWKARREYTVMGDDVNLAARLMAKAGDGQILVNDQVLQRLTRLVDAEALPPLHLKGKQHPVQPYVVTGLRATGEQQ